LKKKKKLRLSENSALSGVWRTHPETGGEGKKRFAL
jgi:hypothetical protein